MQEILVAFLLSLTTSFQNPCVVSENLLVKEFVNKKSDLQMPISLIVSNKAKAVFCSMNLKCLF